MLTFDELDQVTDILTGDEHCVEWVDVDSVLILADRAERANGEGLNDDQREELTKILTAGPYRVTVENIERCFTVRDAVIAGRE